MSTDYRAVFDATVRFSNGGDLTTNGFRLDIPGPTIDTNELAGLLVQHLGLLMVGEVEITNLSVIEEAHKGGRHTVDNSSSRRLVDLSHPITDGMRTYPGIPEPRLGVHLSFEDSAAFYAAGTEFSIGMITMATNTGTYLDAPSHRHRGGMDLSELPLERTVDLDAVLIRLSEIALVDGHPEIPALAVSGVDVAGKAVLIQTGHSATWGTEAYFHDHPHLGAAATQVLVDGGAALVAIDSLNIDGTHTGERPAHTLLLAAGIPVAEHLTNLDQLPPSGFRFHAAVPKVVGLGTFTTRAYAVID